MDKRNISKSEFLKIIEEWGWIRVFEQASGNGIFWKQAAYIAWAALPQRKRQPASLSALADILGYSSTSTFRMWRRRTPEIDEMIAKLVKGSLLPHRADVFQALIDCASMSDPKCHADRKLFLEMTGNYTPKIKQEQDIKVALKTYIGISPDDWDEGEDG